MSSEGSRGEMTLSQGRVGRGRTVWEPYIAGMADIILGILAIIAGVALLTAGQFVLRLVIPI